MLYIGGISAYPISQRTHTLVLVSAPQAQYLCAASVAYLPCMKAGPVGAGQFRAGGIDEAGELSWRVVILRIVRLDGIHRSGPCPG
jgi:hypothetical protein